MTDTKALRLLPCPFCGGEAEWVDFANEAIVRCGSCGSKTSQKYDLSAHTRLSEAIAAWNTRADLPAAEPDKVLEKAAKECDRLAGDPRMYSHNARRAAGQCAAAIRALKSKDTP